MRTGGDADGVNASRIGNAGNIVLRNLCAVGKDYVNSDAPDSGCSGIWHYVFRNNRAGIFIRRACTQRSNAIERTANVIIFDAVSVIIHAETAECVSGKGDAEQ